MNLRALPVAVAVTMLMAGALGAEDTRTQYPSLLANSYAEVGIARVGYPFSPAQLEPGYRVASVSVPHAGARLGLGHYFSPNLALHISYMRPIEWVRYKDVNDVVATRTVWMNVAGLTFRGVAPLSDRFSLYTESGLGIVTRHGFQVDGQEAVKNANYATVLTGGGFTYRMSNTWDVRGSFAWLPASSRFRQPHITVASLGAVLNMRKRSPEKVSASLQTTAIFRRNLFQIGHSSNELGTGINHFVSSTVPIFWGGNVEAHQGVMARYQRNIFHTKSLFSLDWGASVSHWWSKDDGTAFTAYSVFPYFRFTPVRTKPLDLFAFYSVAGPTYVTRRYIDWHDTGGKFTFQDLMGIGCYAGSDRRVVFEAGIGHYSNGNLLPHNAGIKLPITVSMGITW